MSEPTQRQIQIYGTVERLGTVDAAAKALGVTPGAIYSGLTGYKLATGAESPIAMRKAGPAVGNRIRNEAIRQTPERLGALEERVGEQTKVIAAMAAELEDLAEGLRLFFQRQPVILAPARDSLQPTHRRIADGGQGGRREARG